MKNNILITSIGRRVELVESFVNSAKELLSADVYGTELNPTMSSASRFVRTCFEMPRIDSRDYIEKLESLCVENNIGLVVPTLDTELLLLSSNRDRFENLGIHIVVSDFDLVTKCRDKRLTVDLFNSLSIPVPQELSLHDDVYPKFGKPISGSLSKGLVRINSEDEITKDLYTRNDMIFMEYINPLEYDEYTVDAYFNKVGSCKALVPRKRIEVRGGEISKGVTDKGEVYAELLKRLDFIKGARGVLTVQVFVNKANHQIKGIEINPRFGGGFPLALAAGADYPSWLIQEYLMNREIDLFSDWTDGHKMIRYDRAVYF